MASSPARPKHASPLRTRAYSSKGSGLHAHPSVTAQAPADIYESPSRQLVMDFQRLLIDQGRSLQQDLDDQVEQQARKHRYALAQAAAEHDRVRKNAEIARERVELEMERDKNRKSAEEKDRLERERQAKVVREAEARSREKQQLEQRQREQATKAAEERDLEASRRKLEQQKQAEAENKTRLEQQKRHEEELARTRAKQAAASAAKAREDAQKAAATNAPAPVAQQQPASIVAAAAPAQQKPVAAPAAAPVPVAVSQSHVLPEMDQEHARYLALHKQLKAMRQTVTTEGKKLAALKTKLGDWRREIVACMGLLSSDKANNRAPMTQINGILQQSLKFTMPVVDVSSYLIQVPNPAPGQPIPMPGVFVYLLNIFAKGIVRQFISETSGGIKSADPVGVVAVSIFANPAFKVNGTVPLIDILLAKFHVVCPLLFSVAGGSPNTVQGRTRLGWWRDGDGFVPEQRHMERMAGLSAGWAALTLRDFSNTQKENPLPNWHYWRSLASIANVPTDEMGSTQARLLRGLIEGSVAKFIKFYGLSGRAALSFALVDVPARLRKERGTDAAAVKAAGSLEVLRETLRREMKLSL